MSTAPRVLALVALLAACGGPRATSTPSAPPPPDAASSTTTSPPPPTTTEPIAAPSPKPGLRLDRSVVPLQYDLALTIDPAQEEVGGEITIAVQLERATTDVWMHGKDLVIDRARITPDSHGALVAGPATGVRELTSALDGELLHLTTDRPVGPGKATIEIAYRARAPMSMSDQEGLFRQADGGNTYVYSQFEATGARRAFPCFDEPSFKVPWRVGLRGPKGLVALSNTPVESERDDGPLHEVQFATTRPLPSYLVALAVGPFDLVDLGTAGVNHTPMRIAVPRGRTVEAGYAKKISGELLVGLERYLGVPYPYAKLDQVAIPTFLGAMENPGLITYSASILLARPDEESIGFHEECAGTVAHEMAHHWFGDLVTMSWWDDVWLNESFADFMADRVLDDWQPTWGARLHRLRAAQRAFSADGLVSARKIHNPIREHNDIIGAFDTISYAKGGAVLAMFEAWVGRDVFQRTLRDYLNAHAWGNASSQDFIDALAAASRPEISTSFATFIEQGGIPMVSLDVDCSGGKPQLVLAQERFLPIGSTGSADQTWSIPMCVAVPGAGAPQCFLFADRTARIALATAGCPAYVDGNPGGGGYYRVRYAGELGGALVASRAIDVFSRAAALYNLAAMVDAGQQPMSALLAVLPEVAADEHPEILTVALQLATSIEPYVADGDRAAYARFLAASFGGPARAIGWKPRAGEPPVTAQLRRRLLSVAATLGQDPRLVATARKLAAGYLKKPRSMEPGLAEVALSAATHGGDDALARRLEGVFLKTQDHNLREALLAGMVLARDPAVRARTIARLATGELTLEEEFTVFFTASDDPRSRDEAYAFVIAHLDEVIAALPFLARPAIVRISGFYCDDAHRADLDTILRSKVEGMPGGAQALAEATEDLDLCIAKKKAVGADVAAFLRNP